MPKQQPTSVDATFYAQVKPDWSTWKFDVDKNGHPILQGAKVVALTQNRPRRPAVGTVLCKLTMRLPASGFLPLMPEAIVVVPEGMTEAVVVEACDLDPAEPDEVVVP